MKKQLFIGLLATVLTVTAMPVGAIAATTDTKATTNPATKTVTTTSTTKATSTTNSAITTTGGAVNTTDSAITTEETTTDSGINAEAKAPEVISPITLSLDAAYKKMAADSPQAILAKYTLDSELAVGKGHSEKISSINQAEKSDSFFVDTSNKAMLQASRAFANTQAPKNYEATMNELKKQTYEMYYNYKYTETQVQVAKDNLARVQSVYNSTMLQFKVGKVSKLDTLTAEINLNTAKDNYQMAVNGLSQMKMNFNLFMGYNIHQTTTLSGALEAYPLPTKDVDTAVKDALATRNEITGAKYRVEIAGLAFKNVKDYPSSSATYKNAQVSLQMAEQGAKSAPGQVEIDVRTKYMDMKQKYDAVQSGKKSFENSKEASRLGQLQYENGFITVNDLSGINLNTFNTQQAYFKSILDYNLAVEEYNLASGVGIKAAAIQ